MEGLLVAGFAANAAFALLQVIVVVALLRAARSQVNLALAWYLAISAANFVAIAIENATHDAFLWANSEVAAVMTSVLAVFAYALFLGLGVPSPLVWWLRIRWVQALAIAAGPAFVVLPLVLRAPLLVGPRGAQFGPDGFPLGPVLQLYLTPIALLAIGLALLGTGAAVDAWRRAPPGSLAARRARGYLLAFAFNDAALATGFGYVVPMSTDTYYVIGNLISPMLGIVFVALLARSLLRDQLFDFDLKLKLNIKRGTVVAIFAAVFVIVAQVASNYLQGAFGWLAGGVAAGAMLLVLRPIERAADRVADRAMPRVRDTDEYRTVRKREVYRAAVESAMEDGVVTDRERNVLATLADQLGLGVKETLEIEREAAGAALARPSVSG